MLLIFSFHLSALGLISIEVLVDMGFLSPFITLIRGGVVFIYLTFFPGFLILRILKLHELGKIKTILYALGLSISSLILFGIFVNIILPILNISNPISLFPLAVTLTMFISSLSILAYLRDQDYSPSPRRYLNLINYVSPAYLFLTLLPLIAILFARIAPINNYPLVILVFSIGIIPIVILFRRFIPRKVYPFALLMISLALMFHLSMVSAYPRRLNVDLEYYFLDSIVRQGYWNPSLDYITGASTSITILGPIYKILGSIESNLMFNIIYPTIFSFTPVALYTAYNKNLGQEFSFISAFFWLSFPYLFLESILLRRQQVSILFLALIILTLFDQEIPDSKKSVLLVLLAFSLISSHYTLGIIFILIIVLSYLIKRALVKMRSWTAEKTNELSIGSSGSKSNIKGSFIAMCIVCGSAWYFYISSGEILNSLIEISNQLFINLSEFLNASSRSSLVRTAFGEGLFSTSLIGMVYQITLILTELFILIGFIGMIRNIKEYGNDCISLKSSSILLLAIFITIPYASTIGLPISRLYFILLIILSPLFIIGFKTFWKFLSNFYNKYKKLSYLNNVSRVNSNFKRTFFGFSLRICISIIILIYFIFNSGLVFSIGNYPVENSHIPISPSLSYHDYDSGHYSSQEIYSARSLSKLLPESSLVYADTPYGLDLISCYYEFEFTDYLPNESRDIDVRSYTFLRSWNINENEICVSDDGKGYQRKDTDEYFGKSKRETIIYNAGNSTIFLNSQ